MTPLQKEILDKIPSHAYYSPTEIAKIYWGAGTHKHSAWASPICLRMVKAGLMTRSKRGWYAKVGPHTPKP